MGVACQESLKSMSSLAIRLGAHLLETSCAKQSTVALSSGEAEYYAITRGSAAGILVQNILADLDRKCKLIDLTDSSAAKGICHRRGVGRVKHLELKELWVQDEVDKAQQEVHKVGTDKQRHRNKGLAATRTRLDLRTMARPWRLGVDRALPLRKYDHCSETNHRFVVGA